jgi:hypothetical protein
LDQIDEDTRRGGRIQYVTYLDDLRVKKETGPNADKPRIKLPGDVSETSETQIPWMQVIKSNSSLIALVIIIIILMIISVTYYSRFRAKAGKPPGRARGHPGLDTKH